MAEGAGDAPIYESTANKELTKEEEIVYAPVDSQKPEPDVDYFSSVELNSLLELDEIMQAEPELYDSIDLGGFSAVDHEVLDFGFDLGGFDEKARETATETEIEIRGEAGTEVETADFDLMGSLLSKGNRGVRGEANLEEGVVIEEEKEWNI